MERKEVCSEWHTCKGCGKRFDSNHNGYANYETWAVALWLDNDQVSHLHVQEMTLEVWKEAEPGKYRNKSENARDLLADRLKTMLQEGNPLASDASLWSDLLGAAVAEVDFSELADDYLRNWINEMAGDIAAEDLYKPRG